MRIAISISDIQAIKADLRKAHPETKPSNRMEAAAVGLGFKTYAGFRATLTNGPIFVEPNDSIYYSRLGVSDAVGTSCSKRVLSRAIWRIPLCRVLDEHPDLTQCGFDSIWQGDRDELALPIPERETLLAGRRHEAYEDGRSTDQFELAMRFFSQQKMIKSLNRMISSYVLKHRAEGLSRHYGLFTHLGNYVSNGMLIAAAYASGFMVRRIRYDSYNAWFNISMQTVRLADGQRGRSKQECRDVVTAMYADVEDRRAV